MPSTDYRLSDALPPAAKESSPAGKWLLKVALQGALSALPGGERFNYYLQRHVTKSLPPADDACRKTLEWAREHLDALVLYSEVPLGEARFFEFGAGWTLAGPLAFHACGVDHQVVVDICRLVDPALVDRSIDQVDRLRPRGPGGPRPMRALRSRDPKRFAAELRESYGIDYLAPCDARSTDLPAERFDYITSTHTMEHIPLSELRQIMLECRRILRHDGIMSCLIDYADHFSYFDPGVSAYNFLKYPDRVWNRWLTPRLHYQNRLRHKEYLQLFEETGFEVLHAKVLEGSPEDVEVACRLSKGTKYRSFEPEELAARGSHVLLRKRWRQDGVDR